MQDYRFGILYLCSDFVLKIGLRRNGYVDLLFHHLRLTWKDYLDTSQLL